MIFFPMFPLSAGLLLSIPLVVLLIRAPFFLFKKRRLSPPSNHPKPQLKNIETTVISSHDLKAVAGDDVLTTQIDLARAYLELGKKKLAKQILDHVMSHGNLEQQAIAKHLIIKLI